MDGPEDIGEGLIGAGEVPVIPLPLVDPAPASSFLPHAANTKGNAMAMHSACRVSRVGRVELWVKRLDMIYPRIVPTVPGSDPNLRHAGDWKVPAQAAFACRHALTAGPGLRKTRPANKDFAL